MFINDLPDNLVCNPKLFTDDVSLNVVMLDKNISTNYLKDDLIDWSVKWKMVFNPDTNKPAEEVIFTNRNSTSYDTRSFPGVDVKTVDFHKHLGFVLAKLIILNMLTAK